MKIVQPRIWLFALKIVKSIFDLRKKKPTYVTGFEPEIFKFAYPLHYPFTNFKRCALKIL